MIEAYSEQVKDIEVQLLAAVLAGSAAYAGKQLTATDIEELGLSDVVTASELNEYMRDEHLDLLASNVGVNREPAQRAETQLRFDVSGPGVEVPHGHPVSTDDTKDPVYVFYADVTGDAIKSDGSLDFSPSVHADAVAGDGQDEYYVEVDAVAAETGPGYNVGTDKITHLRNPQAGINSVTNNEPATGGSTVQSTSSLRSDVQSALFDNSEGGTKAGLQGALNREVPGLTSVELIEFTQNEPPYVDVYAHDGEQSALVDAIEEYKPLGVRHNMLRPATIQTAISMDLLAENVSEDEVVSGITTRLNSLAVGDSLYASAVIADVSNLFVNVDSVSTINLGVDSVSLDHAVYEQGTDQYELSQGPLGVIQDETYIVTDARRVDDTLPRYEFTLLYPPESVSSVTAEAVAGGAPVTIADNNMSIDTSGSEPVLAIENVALDSRSEIQLSYTAASSEYGINTVYHADWIVDGESDLRGTELSSGEFSVQTDSTFGQPNAIDISASTQFSADDRLVVDYDVASSRRPNIRASDGELLTTARMRAEITKPKTDFPNL